MSQSIVVIGSVNLDYTATASRFPAKGETILGQGFSTQPGGKGGNQAIAASKLGGDVEFIGAIGRDAAGEALKENFERFGVKLQGLDIVDDVHTGIAQIIVAERDNMIVVVSGANMEVTTDRVQAHLDLIDQSDIVVVQLEIPLETVTYLVDYAYQQGKTIITNPAPAQALPKSVIDQSTYITPNVIELKVIFGQARVEEILASYPNKIVYTCGSKGAYFHDGDSLIHVAPEVVNVVDTTGAGDTFNGALAVALSEGQPLLEAVRFANRAAAMAITQTGAQTAMPTRQELEGAF